MSRRAWLAATIAGAVGSTVQAVAERPEAEAATEDRRVAEIREQARHLGLEDFQVGRTDHYLGVGNALDSFREAALEICEGLARDYLQHFRGKRFELQEPSSRLILVILASPSDFERYLGIAPGGPVRGVYDLDSNHLIVCDNRGEGNPRAERANTVALFHEATHQLSFNTGLFDRRGDVPRCVSEGLAMYGEVRRPRGRVRVGATNRERLAVLAEAARRGRSLFPAADLITHDERLETAETQQFAYAQSWLLIYHALRDSEILPRFRRYLDAIRERRSSEHRLEDAREHLGDLDRLDRDLARAANRLLRD